MVTALTTRKTASVRTLSRVLDDLEEMGFVERRFEEDVPVATYSLTPKGNLLCFVFGGNQSVDGRVARSRGGLNTPIGPKPLCDGDGLPGMALGIDREKLLYGVGVLLGVAAAAYFGFQLFDQVSPVTTAVVLFAGFLAFLIAGVGADAELLDVVAYAFAAGCYLVFVAYVPSRFDTGDGGTFLLLAGSSAFFVALGYLSQQGRLVLSERHAGIGVIVVVVVAVGVVGVDLVGAQPSTTTEFEDGVEVPDERERVTLGTLTVRNGFFLPREMDVPRFQACVYGPDFRPAPLGYDPTARSELLRGGGSRQYDLVMPGRAFYRENGTLREGFQDGGSVPVVERSECPESPEEPKVVVVENPLPPYR